MEDHGFYLDDLLVSGGPVQRQPSGHHNNLDVLDGFATVGRSHDGLGTINRPAAKMNAIAGGLQRHLIHRMVFQASRGVALLLR